METKFVFRKSIIMFGIALFSFTMKTKAAISPGDSTPIEFKYIGRLHDQPVFELNIPNPGNDEYTVSIFDEEGYLFYFDITNSKNISRKFQLLKNELPNDFFN